MMVAEPARAVTGNGQKGEWSDGAQLLRSFGGVVLVIVRSIS
jgi:hypothetical protein